MKRTTISLSDDLALLLEREARRRATLASAVARQALEAHFGLGPAGPGRPLGFVWLGRSGRADTAERFEDELAHEWKRDHQRGNDAVG